MKYVPVWILPVILVASSGCMSGKSTGEPVDTGFGNREADEADGRSTVVVTSIPNAADYAVSSVPYESADVRVGTTSNGSSPVEILVKGSFPDSCTELHGANQTRSESERKLDIRRGVIF